MESFVLLTYHLALNPPDSSVLSHMTGFPSLLRVNNISLCELYHVFFIHLSVHRHVGYLYILTIVKSATMNTGMKISQDPYFSYFGYIPKSGLAV